MTLEARSWKQLETQSGTSFVGTWCSELRPLSTFEDFMDSVERNFAEAIRSAVDRYLDGRRQGADGPSASGSRRAIGAVWFTVEETVRYLGLRSRMALYQAVRRGQVPSHHFGRRLRFRRSELDEALARR
jgi:excisionase family DNA binding protein